MTAIETIEDDRLYLQNEIRPEPHVLLLDERAVGVILHELVERQMDLPMDAWAKTGGNLFGLMVVRVPDTRGQPLVVDARGRPRR